jgi:tetratricopeptide (TPR) repeat protein
MKVADLSYISRLELEKQLRDFLLASLAPKSGNPKALLISGEAGVGKKTLINQVIQSDKVLQNYSCVDIDLKTGRIKDWNKPQDLRNKLYDGAVDFAKESLPYPLNPLLGIIAIFLKDAAIKPSSPERLGSAKEVEDFVEHHLKKHPTLLRLSNFNEIDPDHVKSIAGLEDINQQSPFAVLILANAATSQAPEALKNIRRFLKRDEWINHVIVKPLTAETSMAALTEMGLSPEWAETLQQFSDGYPEILNSIWRALQEDGVLHKVEENRWAATDQPMHILSPKFIRNYLTKLVERRSPNISREYGKFLPDGLLVAAAMGETFLPQAVAEIMPKENEYSNEETKAWEDCWYDFLETSNEHVPAIARAVESNGKPEILLGDSRQFFVYTFGDRRRQYLVAHLAKKLCDRTPQNKLWNEFLYERVCRLESWLQGHFKNNWQSVLPYRIAVNRTLGEHILAGELFKHEQKQKRLADLEQRIHDEQLRVENGAAAKSLYHLLVWYSEELEEAGKYLKSLIAIQQAKQLVDQQKVVLDELKLAYLLNQLGLAYDYNGLFAEAEPLYRRSLEIREQQLGPEHLDVATSLNNLALLLWSQGKYVEAEPLYRRSLKIREQQLGPEHPYVATILNNLALLLKSQGKYAEAEPLYRRSLEIDEKAFGHDHPEVATDLNGLAGLLESQGKYAEAEPLYRRSLEIRERKLGPDHPDVAQILNNLGTLLMSQGKYAEAEPLCRRSLKILEQQLGPEHPDVATGLNSLATLLTSQGKFAEAEPLYRRSLKIWEQQLGPEHPDVALSLNNLAELLRSQGKYAEAEPLFRRSLKIWEQQLGPEHPDVAKSLNNLATLLQSQGKSAEAEPLYRRSFKIWEQQLGPEHPDVALSLNNLAGFLDSQGKSAEAEPLYRRSLEIWEKQLGPEHPDVATSLNNLALLLDSQGKSAEAEPLFRRSLAICEKTLGPEHPNTQTVRKNLTLLLEEMWGK